MSLHAEARTAFKTAILAYLSHYEKIHTVTMAPALVWRKNESGGWTGVYENRPSLSGITMPQAALQAQADLVEAAMEHHHPGRMRPIGTATLGTFNLPWEHHIGAAAIWLHDRHGSFQVSEAPIDDFLNGVSALLDASTIKLRFQAPLMNFHGPEGVDRIPLVGDAAVVRLTEDEVTELYGGSPFHRVPSSYGHVAVLEWALVGTFEESLIRDLDADLELAADPLYDILAKSLLALRTFLPGPVGHDVVWVKPADPRNTMVHRMGRTYGDGYVPLGRYEIRAADMAPLQAHAQLLEGSLDSALEAACARLSNGEIRLSPRDKLFDAVVGLEAILLAVTPEDYRGELRYRFAYNYAALQITPEDRLAAFRVAQKLYDLRSAIAHGGRLEDSVRLGEENLTKVAVANRACDMLRSLIKRFLPEATQPPYRRAHYWSRRLFGLPD